jgi:hypothetical protein
MFALLALLVAGPAPRGGTEDRSGPSVADAREALAFWRGRLSRLAWHRRAARREARTMVSATFLGV